MRIAIILTAVFAAMPLYAQQLPEPVDGGAPPPLPEEGDIAEPEVRIIQRDRDTVREYRVGGKLVAIEVIPKSGKPY